MSIKTIGQSCIQFLIYMIYSFGHRFGNAYLLKTRALPFWLELFSNPNTILKWTKIALLDVQSDIEKTFE